MYMNRHQYAKIKCHQRHFYWLVSRSRQQSHNEMVNPRFLIEFYRNRYQRPSTCITAQACSVKNVTEQMSPDQPDFFTTTRTIWYITMLVTGCVPRLLELYQACSSRLFLFNGCWLVRSHFSSLKMIQIFMFSRVQTWNLSNPKLQMNNIFFLHYDGIHDTIYIHYLDVF